MNCSSGACSSSEFLRAISAAIDRAEHALKHVGIAPEFPGQIAEEVLDPIKQLDIIVKPSTGGGAIPIDDLVNEMALLDYEDGFTFSPIPDENGVFLTPNAGHCVALPGSNCPIEPAGAAATNPPSNASAEAHDPLSETAILYFSVWAKWMAIVFETGLAWLGGYRRQDGGFDVEATLVFDFDRRDEAHDAAQKWKQQAYCTISNDGSGETNLDNTPPGSVFESLFLKSSRIRGEAGG